MKVYAYQCIGLLVGYTYAMLHLYAFFCRTGLHKTTPIVEDCKRLQVNLVSLLRAALSEDVCINLKVEIDGNFNFRFIRKKMIIFL